MSQAADTSTPQELEADQTFGINRLKQRLFEPVDIASIAVFRIAFGALLFWEVWRFFEYDWIRRFYIVRDFYFKYYGFEWIHPWPGDGMYYHFAVVGLVALCVMAGFLYRIASWLLFFGFTYWYLLDQTRYLNHFYLICLLAFLMALIPAHRAKSFDARLRPSLQRNSAPAWSLWLLRVQVGLVYFYAGIAKLNSDWLQGEPIRAWLARRSDYPLIGPLLDTEASVYLFAYGGLVLDLVAAPALLWSKTRPWAFAACAIFHVLNIWMFNIGIFPVLMLAATLIMFPPDWPRKICLFFVPMENQDLRLKAISVSETWKRAIGIFLVAYLLIQVLVPLRHLLYEGNVHWTEEGHRFSWRMKLRDKDAEAQFYATDPSKGLTWLIDHRKYLSSAQSNRVGRWPDMCLQFAHFMADELKKDGHEQIEIRVKAKASLNGRKPQYLIDPEIDLSKEPRTLRKVDWILPLTEPLQRHRKPK